jgi:hypothetical protein
MSAAARNDGVVTLRREQPVDIAAIERELTRLWHEADPDAAGESKHVTRACLWNLLYHVAPGPKDGERRTALRELLQEVTVAVPSRIVVLETRPETDQPPDGEPIQAWVSANCLRLPEGPSLICAEEVSLVGYGDAGVRHFPSLARALRAPDLPVGLLWIERLPARSRLLRELLTLSHRLIVDSHSAAAMRELADLQELVQGLTQGVADIGWMRLRPVRLLFAGLFDAPEHAEKLARVESIHIETTRGGRAQGLLLAGWLLARLGIADITVNPNATEPGQFAWTLRQDGRRVPMDAAAHPGEGGQDELIALYVRADGCDFGVTQVDAEHVALHSPAFGEKQVALHGWDKSELIAAALGSHGLDPAFREALALAARLAEAEEWNQ